MTIKQQKINKLTMGPLKKYVTCMCHFSSHSPVRSSRPDVFCKKGILSNFAKFTGKHLCHSLFFNKVADLRPATITKETLTQVFSCEFREISKNTFFHRTPLVTVSDHCLFLSVLLNHLPYVTH